MSYLYTMLNNDTNEVSTRFEHVRSELASENEETRPDVVSSSLDVSTSNVLEDEVTEGDIQFLHNLDVVGVERMMKMKLPYGYSMQALDPKLVAGGIVALLGLVGLGFLAKRMEWFKSDSDKNSDAGSKGSDKVKDASNKVESASSSGTVAAYAELTSLLRTTFNVKQTMKLDDLFVAKGLPAVDAVIALASVLSSNMVIIQDMVVGIKPVLDGLTRLKGDKADLYSAANLDNIKGNLDNTLKAIHVALEKMGDPEEAISKGLTAILGDEPSLKIKEYEGTDTDDELNNALEESKWLRSELKRIRGYITQVLSDEKIGTISDFSTEDIQKKLAGVDDHIGKVALITNKTSSVLEPMGKRAMELSNSMSESNEENKDSVAEAKEIFKNVGTAIKMIVAINEVHVALYEIVVVIIQRMAVVAGRALLVDAIRTKWSEADTKWKEALKETDVKANILGDIVDVDSRVTAATQKRTT